MKTFGDYARYYDLLYRDKDYLNEVGFLSLLLNHHNVREGRLLEIGCGTGRHAVCLAKNGWNVTGVDLSETMVQESLNRRDQCEPDLQQKLEFFVGDARTIRLSSDFDLVISLFHVTSYQTGNNDLESFFKTSRAHLKKGGFFIFDFWYGPAVLTDLPQTRVKRMNDDHIEVIRIAEPTIYEQINQVDVKYTILIKNIRTGAINQISENHRMRYLFLPELDIFLKSSGFNMVGSGRWLTSEAPSLNSWYTYVVAKAV
jgi:SAM-dependent methyltransferase